MRPRPKRLFARVRESEVLLDPQSISTAVRHIRGMEAKVTGTSGGDARLHCCIAAEPAVNESPCPAKTDQQTFPGEFKKAHSST